MEKATIIYKNLEDKIPFSFSKFNDGEQSLLSPGSVASRGYQSTSFLLRSKLFEALIWTHPSYYLGTVCKECHSRLYEIQTTLRGKENCTFLANTLINSNLEQTISVLKRSLPTYERIYIVLSKEADHKGIENEMDITFTKVYTVENSNAFDEDYNRLKDEILNVPDGSIVLFCCGPLGRVLAYEWFKTNDKITCLELGSLFDPISKNTAYLYHYGALIFCETCNPSKSRGFIEYLNPDSKIEHYYIPIKIALGNGADNLLLYFERKGMRYEYLYTLGLSAESQDDKIRYFEEAFKNFPGKWEAGLKLYQITNNFQILKELYQGKVGMLNEHSDRDVYDWEVYYAISVNAWYAKEYEMGKEASKILLERDTTPDWVKESTRNNIRFYNL